MLTFLEAIAKADLRSLYIHRPLSNGGELVAWAKAQGFATTLPRDDLHATQIYCKTQMEWPAAIADQIVIPAGFGKRWIERLGYEGAVVLCFESTEMQLRWLEMLSCGATSDYPSFRPHVTLTYKLGENIDIDAIDPYQGALVFDGEVFAEIKSDGPRWLDTVQEKNMVATVITEADVIAFLRGNGADSIADIVEKDMGVGDVHQPTALGNQGGKKPKTFADALAELKKPVVEDVDKRLGAGWEIEMTMLKAEPTRQEIFGWASVSTIDGKLVVDKQGHYIMPEDLEAAAYDFVLYSRTQGDMHEKKGVGRTIESMFFSKEKQDLMKIDLGMEGWWIGFKVDDPKLWDAIKRGERPEFSIGGRGTLSAS